MPLFLDGLPLMDAHWEKLFQRGDRRHGYDRHRMSRSVYAICDKQRVKKVALSIQTFLLSKKLNIWNLNTLFAQDKLTVCMHELVCLRVRVCVCVCVCVCCVFVCMDTSFFIWDVFTGHCLLLFQQPLAHDSVLLTQCPVSVDFLLLR